MALCHYFFPLLFSTINNNFINVFQCLFPATHAQFSKKTHMKMNDVCPSYFTPPHSPDQIKGESDSQLSVETVEYNVTQPRIECSTDHASTGTGPVKQENSDASYLTIDVSPVNRHTSISGVSTDRSTVMPSDIAHPSVPIDKAAAKLPPRRRPGRPPGTTNKYMNVS